MRIGLVGRFGDSPERDFTYVRDLAQAAEGAGFSSLGAPEHVVFFGEYASSYPYSADGSPPWRGDTGIYDPLFVLTAAALATRTLELATAILIVPQRPALLTAKEALTLDQLSAGRFWMGAGAGWSWEEYAALGVPFVRRGARFDEYIEAMRAAWTMDRAHFAGEFVQFEDVVLRPKPVSASGPRIIVGGESRGAMRRAARLGDGWYGWWAAGELAPHLEALHAELDAFGRAPGHDFSLKLGLPLRPDDTPEAVAQRANTAQRQGVEELMVAAPIRPAHLDADVTRWADALELTRRATA